MIKQQVKNKLKEAYTHQEYLELMKTKLGIVDILHSFSKENSTDFKELKKDVIDVLKSAANDEIREYSTTKLNNAWLSVRGASGVRRNLDKKQPAYIFVYLNNNSIFDGTNGKNVYLYKLNTKLDQDQLNQRFEIALQTVKGKGLINKFEVSKGSLQGEGVIISFKPDSTSSDTSTAQKAFRDAFLNFKLDNKSKEPSILNNLKGIANNLKKAFEKPQKVDLKPFSISKTENKSGNIEMYWTPEEKSLAKEIIDTNGLNDILAADDDVAQAQKTSKDTPADDKAADKPKSQKLSKNGFAQKILAKYKTQGGGKSDQYKRFKKAREDLKTGWNKEAAREILKDISAVADSYAFSSKEKVTKDLRNLGLIESKQKKLKEMKDKNDNLITLMNFDILEDSVFEDKDECLATRSGMSSLLELLDEIVPTFLGIESLDDLYDVLRNANDLNAIYYEQLLDTAIENAKFVDSQFQE